MAQAGDGGAAEEEEGGDAPANCQLRGAPRDMRGACMFVLVAAVLAVAVEGRAVDDSAGRRLAWVQKCDASLATPGAQTSYRYKLNAASPTNVCFKISVDGACADATANCCLGAEDPAPKLRQLIVTPPAGSTCAQKGANKKVKWTVGGKPKTANVGDGSIKVPLSKLPPTGGDVCVDFSGSTDAACNDINGLCGTDGCNLLVFTKRVKKQPNPPGEDKSCCVKLGELLV
ncbi:hypothetical protein Rsub_00455 [Raphidocelis subcapitata]|uniref:Pherophorin domain-containing protein n=1 Tax=Raphidocelis subcapitata TaxID=307507 RepID=A0A2V0NKB1_9CHLO|nr:hypothetical protein Rsub_00455 [Raphidocelis subcapitata]|eukprot:GBF87744.1 hypothetical protein Rsub_00455 [Raphidocelis subcapitata]